MTYAVDKISGAYFNPAITIGFTVTGHLKPQELPLYIIVQVVGAMMASAIVFLMFIGFSLKERIGYKPFGGIAIGAFIAAAGIIGIPVSGGSMNPARSFGPALVSINLTYEWIYWIAPIIGAILAVLCFRAIKDHRAEGISNSSHERDEEKRL